MLERVGFIGLGDIGGPMARNLCDRFETHVFDLRGEAVQALVEAGARSASSCREVASRSELVGVCVLDDRGVRAVLEGENGVLAGAAPGTLVLIHSTVHPDTIRELAKTARARDVEVIDAPMTGGAAVTEKRQLRYMVGGEPEQLERCRPYLEASAGEIIHCGALGAGSVAKLCNNLVQFIAWLGYTEADRLAANAGLEREKLFEVLGWIMNENARTMMAGRSAFEADPDNDFLKARFTEVMLLAEKDLSLALEVGRTAGVTLPATALCTQELARLFAVPDPKRR